MILKRTKNGLSERSIGIFEFNDGVKLQGRIDVGLAFGCKNSNFSIVFEQFVYVDCKYVR